MQEAATCRETQICSAKPGIAVGVETDDEVSLLEAAKGGNHFLFVNLYKTDFFFAPAASCLPLKYIVKYLEKKRGITDGVETEKNSKGARIQKYRRNLTDGRSHAIRATTLYKRDVCTSIV